MYLAFEDELEGERALAGQVGVALRVVDAGLQHPRLVENGEARRFIVQPSDEVIRAVRPELHLWKDERVEDEILNGGEKAACGKDGVVTCHRCFTDTSARLFFTCKADLLVAEQAEDAVVELHVSAVALVHLSQYAHQLCTSLRGMGALALVRRQLVERALPGAADPLVLALRHPGNVTAS